MNSTGKKSIALFLVFSLMMLSVNLYARERRGARLSITKKDGQQIQGELITVKPNSLFLLYTTGKDVSVGITDIQAIRILKKSKVLLGAGLGLLMGAGIGALWASSLPSQPKWPVGNLGAGVTFLVVTVSGPIIGGILGAVAGTDKTIQIEGKSPRWIEFYLEKLSKKSSYS